MPALSAYVSSILYKADTASICYKYKSGSLVHNRDVAFLGCRKPDLQHRATLCIEGKAIAILASVPDLTSIRVLQV